MQRPSSVVKELLENAIDAGSTSIGLIIKDAGKIMQVIDDGVGMSTNDARLCFGSVLHQKSDKQKICSLYQLKVFVARLYPPLLQLLKLN